MIEWIQHWDEMRFYYWSGLSWIMILPVYLGGVLLLGLLWWLLAKVWKKAWIVIIAMLPVLAIAPWWEELNIAWNFGQLCKKNAGIFVYRTVEVDGFYDASRPTHDGPRNSQAAEYLDRNGYRFYEMVFRNVTGGPNRVVHLEKEKGAWIATVLDRPTAKYHYRVLASHTPVSHQIRKFEEVVVDAGMNDVLGRYLDYARSSPWYFVGLDRPLMFCKEAENNARERGAIFSPRMVWVPKN